MAILTGVALPPKPITTMRLVLRETQARDRPGYIVPAVPGAYPGLFGFTEVGTFEEHGAEQRPGVLWP